MAKSPRGDFIGDLPKIDSTARSGYVIPCLPGDLARRFEKQIPVDEAWRFREDGQMTDEEMAARFVSNGFIWMRKKDNRMELRLCELSREEADGLKERFSGGSIADWKGTGSWQWQTGGRIGNRFLVAMAPWIELKPHLRELMPALAGVQA